MQLEYIRNKKMIFIVFLALISAAFESTTLAIIYVFLGAWERGSIDVYGYEIQVLNLVYLLVIFISVSAVMRLISIFYQNTYLQDVRAELSTKITDVVKVGKFSKRGSTTPAELMSASINEVELFVNYWLLPIVNLFVNSIALTMILLFLAILDHQMLFMVLLIIGGSYLSIYLFVRGYQRTLGLIRHEANRERYEIGSAIFRLASEFFVNGTYKHVVAKYREQNIILSKATAKFLTIAQAPRIVIEFITLTLLITYLSFLDRQNLEIMIPILISFLFAGYRALPYAQGIFNALNALNYSEASSNSLNSLIVESTHPENTYGATAYIKFPIHIRASGSGNYNFSKSIELDIKSGDVIHITGDSGVGKSLLFESLFDISDAYTIDVTDADNKPVSLSKMRSNISYLSQNSILFEGTVKENLLWGGTSGHKLLHQCAEAVGLKVKQLDEKVSSLSGGQKQRVLLARTLLVNRKIFVFDEPFNGLDETSAKQILSNVKDLFPNAIFLITNHGLLSGATMELVIKNDNFQNK